jgi:MAP/microtubule affinity-regulating kinase
LIHRDLKLENILLAKKNSNLIKIVDFGIAGIAINLNVEKINVGSLRYMAPETLTGHSRQIGPFIDVWAMGVILYTLVTGEMPFKGQTNKEILHSITSA